MKKALIIGASGLIGSHLYKSSLLEFRTLGTFRSHSLDNLVSLDLTDRNAIKKIILDFKPDFVFLPAAFTNVDLCEEKKEFCWQINVEGVRNIISSINNTDTKLIYFSTDYIFNGQSGPYSEEAQPGPLSVYGNSKLEGEEIVEQNLHNFLIIRTTCVYGWEPQEKNFVLGLIKRIKRNEMVRAPCDQITTPTYAPDLARVVLRLAEENRSGIYNVAGSSLISRFEFALLVAEIFGLDKNLISGVKTEELSQKAKRPLNGGLRIDKISRELNIHMPTVKEGLISMRKERPYEFSGQRK